MFWILAWNTTSGRTAKQSLILHPSQKGVVDRGGNIIAILSRNTLVIVLDDIFGQ
jgi:hypothetical protein